MADYIYPALMDEDGSADDPVRRIALCHLFSYLAAGFIPPVFTAVTCEKFDLLPAGHLRFLISEFSRDRRDGLAVSRDRRLHFVAQQYSWTGELLTLGFRWARASRRGQSPRHVQKVIIICRRRLVQTVMHRTEHTVMNSIDDDN